MPTRTDEIFRLLGISENTQPGPAKTTSRQAEIENILSFTPSIRQKKQTAEFPQPAAPLKGELSGAENNGLTSDSDVGAALRGGPQNVSPAGETWTPQSPTATAPLAGEPNTSSGAAAPPSPQGEGLNTQGTGSEAERELERLKPVLEEAKRLQAERDRFISGAMRDPAKSYSAQTRLDHLLEKNGYSSIDELNDAVTDHTIASGGKLTFGQTLDRTVFSGDWWKNILSGGAEQWYGSQLNGAGTMAGNIESPGREGAGMVYENELSARNDWATTLEEAKTGVIKMDAEGIAEIERILGYYDNTLLPSLRSGVEAYETLAEDSAAAADEIMAKGRQNTEKAKEGLGWGGKLAVDVLTQGTMMALDKATGAPSISMFTRGFGSGAQEARQAGATAQEQISYGAAVGTVEALTEKLFDGLAGIYGKGAADKLVEDTIAKLAKTRPGQATLRLLASGFNEGMEEILSDAVNPLLRTIYSGKSVKEEYSGEQLSQWLYDGLVGAIMGTGLTSVNPETYAFNPGKPQISAEQEKTGLQSPKAAQNQTAQPGTEQKNTARSEAESTAVNTDPAQHTSAEQAVIDEYQAAVDNRLLAFIEKWRTLKNPDYKKRIQMPIAEITDRAAGDIQRLIGLNVTDYKHMLSGNALEHIEIRHGKNGEADHSLSDPNDIARMGYVLENYDVIEPVLDSQGRQKQSTQYSNADNTMAPLISFKKSVNGTYYVVEAVPDSAAKQLRVVSAYMQKKSGSTDQVLNMANAPQLTPKVPHGANTPASTPPVNAEALRVTSKNAALMPDNSIQQSGENYNKDSQSSLETGNTTANTDPAAAARQQQYQTEIAAALEAGDYQQALNLFKEYGNPNLRAMNEVQTLKAFGEFANAAGYGVSPVETKEIPGIVQKQAEIKKLLENAANSSTMNLPDVPIGRSLGAKLRNYEVMDLDTGEMFRFVEGSRLQNVKVFAGKGTKERYNNAWKYAQKYGGNEEDWQHAKGFGLLETWDGDRRAEVHWSQCNGIGLYDFFVKRWLE